MNTENILSFLADNYKYFMIASGVLLIALIGFIVDGKKKKKQELEKSVPLPQGGFTQGENMQAVPNSVDTVQYVQNNEQPTAAVANNSNTQNIAPTQINQQPTDTIFTSAPVDSSVNNIVPNNNEEKLIIEEPQAAINMEPTSMESIMTEAPSVTVSPQVETLAAPTPVVEVKTEPEEVVIQPQPQMQAPQMEVPISMEREEPVMQSVQPTMVAPQQVQQTPVNNPYQNTIQQ